MRSIPIAFVVLIIFSCSNHRKQEIVVPKLHAGFYAGALDQINEQLSSDPSNTNLIEQKLYYCDQLGWPTNCLSALDKYKAKYGMRPSQITIPVDTLRRTVLCDKDAE
ncbi:MAG: hypothetical protein AAF391_13900 [Bacteroidota bacterium]